MPRKPLSSVRLKPCNSTMLPTSGSGGSSGGCCDNGECDSATIPMTRSTAVAVE
eukprot:CAMPEP_0203878450 /NCGR_PEP_ID=MMETSP0359-20131031/22989_1 /ASSEMBLY_ACC=CAM_ASM_000338 /TAXON_ID=268821 /ORGANISM="Scrippsiella Hangoei, Strain SHTV-5" /LENGTH=53 /DNA_ID=CAMNT_0050797625 /DNA_START=24 /DNA_END=182 /DNA_ORIENTATION=+